MGSGTTAIGALKSQRHYIGYETNKDYIHLAKERIYPYKINNQLFA